MKRPVLIHGALLSAALVAAYFTWTRDLASSNAEDEVQILSLRGNLDRVIYKGDERTVEIERRRDDRGAYHWVRVDTMEVPPPPPMPRPAPPPPPAPKPETKAEPKKAEPKKAAAKKAEPKKAEPKAKKAEPKKSEAKKAEPKKAAAKKAGDSLSRDPKADPDKKEAKNVAKKPAAKKAEPKKSESKKAESKKAAEPKKAEPKKAEPKKAGSKKAEVKKAEVKKAEVKKAEVKKAEVKKEEPKAQPKAVTPPAKFEPPKPVVKVRKIQEFKGNKSVEELMKGLANLSAVRSLGKVDADKLKAFGLEGTKKSLTLMSGSTPRVFLIGGNTYGNMDVYLQSKDDGRVFVVRPRLLQDFQYAEFRLVDRSLHGFENNEVERAVITATDGKKRTLVQQRRRDPGGATWADESTPQQHKELFRNWMSKVLGLRVLEYVSPGNKIGGLKPVLTVEYVSAGKLVGFLRLYRQEGPVPKTAASLTEGPGDYYALTENSRTLVKLGRPMGDEVVRDIANVLRE